MNNLSLQPVPARRSWHPGWVLGLYTLMVGLAQAQPVPIPTGADGYDGGKVAQLVARLMENNNVAQRPIDQTINKLFLSGYYDVLDPVHMVFLQTDIDDFNAKYGATINTLTKAGDITPAMEIHDRFLERLRQWEPFIQGLLKEKMDFTKDETFLPDRRKEAWPANEEAAKDLWRRRVKYEVLETRLAEYEKQRQQQLDQKQFSREQARLTELQKQAAKDKDAKAETLLKTQSTLVKTLADSLKKGSENDKHQDPLEILAKRYERHLKDAESEEKVDIVELYLSALTSAFDPHSQYQAPEEAKNFEIQTIKLSLTGIGAVLMQADDGSAKIVSLVPGGPADLNNQLKPNDRVIAVRQENGEAVNVVDMRLNKVVDLIRGPRGTKVTLTVIPADASNSTVHQEITITRDEVRLQDQRAKAKVVERQVPGAEPERLGVLTLEPGFYDNPDKKYSATSDTAKLVGRMKQEHVTGIIIDMRRNGGGLLEQAIQFTSLFVKSGPVVQVKDARGKVTPYLISHDHQIYAGPLLVMTSRFSASAAEIVAAALQDYGRALVVGDKTTHGKGTVQTLVPLREIMPQGTDWDPGTLKVTVQKFYRIGGNSTQLHGVVPDIVLPSIYDYTDNLGEESLPNALPGDEVPPASFTRLTPAGSGVPYLLQRSTERVHDSKDFGYLNEMIDLQKKRNLDKSVSLNEATRRAELDQLDERREAIKEERKGRKVSTDKVYSLDVDMVDAGEPMKLISGPGFQPTKTKDEGRRMEDPEDPDSKEALDMHLEETLNILEDYVAELAGPKNPQTAANPPSKPGA